MRSGSPGPDRAGARAPFWRDLFLIVAAGVIAGCGLVYEYLLSHYAGRTLGMMETAIYGVIGLMIVAMGAGSFAARWVRCPFTGFAWLEAVIAFLGIGMVLLLGALFYFVHQFPQAIAITFGLPESLTPRGGLFEAMTALARAAPYAMSAILGFFIGMEIPLLARAREALHGAPLAHNTGSVYGADYLGAGLGAGLWVFVMLSMEVTRAAAWTGMVNALAGIAFLALFHSRIRGAFWLGLLLILLVLESLATAQFGQGWMERLEDALYRDAVIFRNDTPFQRMAVTRRAGAPGGADLYTFLLNGRQQFSSGDETIYHALLTAPALMSAARNDRVLIIGGGDGLALRDVLRFNPQSVALLELDPAVVAFFSRPVQQAGQTVNAPLLALNENAFSDPRVELVFGDAFVSVDPLLAEGARFDVILVDLPDPGHPDLNRLYSAYFFAKLKRLLAEDGALAIQSTSPYHARKAFLCVGVTLRHAGFAHAEPYHHNVPSFGEWGWTLAVPAGPPGSARIRAGGEPPPGIWANREVILAAFAFGNGFFDDLAQIEVNRLGTHRMYRYHHDAWVGGQGFVDLQPRSRLGPTADNGAGSGLLD